jgi:hypothetical protein
LMHVCLAAMRHLYINEQLRLQKALGREHACTHG